MSSVSETLAARGEQYDRGDYENTATVAQSIKTAFWSGAGFHWSEMTPGMREALEMIANKLARIVAGNPYHADSWHDVAGYATLGEISARAGNGEFDPIPSLNLSASDAGDLYRAMGGKEELDVKVNAAFNAAADRAPDPAPTMAPYATYNAGDKIEPVEADTLDETCGDENCAYCNEDLSVDDEDDSVEEEEVIIEGDTDFIEDVATLIVEELPGVYVVRVDI